ncbi:MAG: lysoplasmalogenase [Leptospiraceae bacterium]|nr:lysoplasmalogenase [Leptospiraceae bacterium]
MFIFLILCIFHFLSIFYFPSNPVLFLTKITPILFLIYTYYKKIGINSIIRKLIFFGLIFSLLGDSFLAFEGYFVPGLGSFLIAQILYSIGFSKQGKLHILRLIPFLVLGGLLYLYLLPSLPNGLIIPVSIYVLALVTMAWRASSRSIPTSKLNMSMAGASIFLVSDALIALTKFKSFPIMYPSFFIMVTYYLAQYLLVNSCKND